MGWGTGDPERVERCKLLLSATKSALYNLKRELMLIEHPDKRPAMYKQAVDATASLDRIESDLNR